MNRWEILYVLSPIPSRIALYPRPVGFPGRTTTSMDLMRDGFRTCSSRSACSDAQLNSSEPQNRTRRGSETFWLELLLLNLENVIPGCLSSDGRNSTLNMAPNCEEKQRQCNRKALHARSRRDSSSTREISHETEYRI